MITTAAWRTDSKDQQGDPYQYFEPSTMAQPSTPSTFPVDPTVPSLQDIRERLDRSERMFATEELEAPAHEEEWEEMKRKRRSDAARRRGKFKRTTLFSKNNALVKGIYVVARGYR